MKKNIMFVKLEKFDIFLLKYGFYCVNIDGKEGSLC